ncbi:MAG: APC family permease [Bifidobacteriaceae bacterium]|jgi:amino acid transporter|nr:APC family permease [Bifidobacteriaceae bacterium]
MTNPKEKKFRLFDAILTVICVVFVAEAAPVVASMGNSQYFWWLFLILAFLLPYGLVAAELSTTYPDEGGLYDWTRRAFGKKWGTRVSWFYWINFPFWMGSLAILFPTIINFLLDPSGENPPLGTLAQILVGLAFIAIITVVSFFRVSDSKWILNIGAVFKVGLAIVLLGLGIWTFVKNGVSATPMTLESFAPFPELSPLGIFAGLGATTIILFNFMGFEVMASFSEDMPNPKRQLPIAIIAGGISIAVIYIASSFGIGVAIPPEEVTADLGMIDAVYFMVGEEAFWLVVLAGVLFLVTLFGNMISWSYGVNYVAMYGAQNHDMPKIFARKNEKRDMPTGAPIVNAILSGIIVVVGCVLPTISEQADSLFWSFFNLSIITLLMSYIPLFPAWLKLRKIDPDRERPYVVPGGPTLNKLFAYVPSIILVITVVLCLVPIYPNQETGILEVVFDEAAAATLVGVLIAVISGECLAALFKSRRGKHPDEIEEIVEVEANQTAAHFPGTDLSSEQISLNEVKGTEKLSDHNPSSAHQTAAPTKTDSTNAAGNPVVTPNNSQTEK